MNQWIDLDADLYKKLQQGNVDTFAEVFVRYNRLLYILAYRYLKSGEEAEDAVQHTFMQLWKNRDSFDFQSGLRGLLFTILKHYILNELRHRQVVFEKHYEMAQTGEEVYESFAQELEDKEMKENLWSAISALPPQKKRICELKIGKGLSNQEIADIMQISIPTVKSHYTQAIKQLREKLEPLMMLVHVFGFYVLD